MEPNPSFSPRARGLVALVLAVAPMVVVGCVRETVDACDDDPTLAGCPDAPDVDAGTDGGADAGGPDGGPCPPCADPTPLCDPGAGVCVACLTEAECEDDGAPFCVDGACVECAMDVDCDEPARARCVDGMCDACSDSAQCPGGLTCVTAAGDARVGTCVACVPGEPGEEAAACGGNSCDPASYACTTTPVASVRRCGACVTDTECSEADDRCVEMFFSGESVGGYCLKRFASGCERPYGVQTSLRESLSGDPAATYCGVDETTTTCDAVLDLVRDATCSVPSDCGLDSLDDGLCERVGGFDGRCTYACSLSAQCPNFRDCNDGYCGGQP